MRLRFRPKQFWTLTPRQLHLLVACDRERLEAENHHAELLAGIIASTVANFGMRELKKSLAPADFMPSRTAAEKPKRKNRKQIAQSIGSFLHHMVSLQEQQQEKPNA